MSKRIRDLTFTFLFDRLELEKDYAANLELDLRDSENREKERTRKDLKAAKKRIRQLNKCLKYIANLK